ncbi:hypothetical protein SDC9_71992 [bioreactor metagenome]|uniref:Lipoyl-binding domain-containing protein n=1 Tax=bioreactor metagenome TaxID=1076179 RepID=A0A644YBE0_9ZZZZ
MKKFIITYKGQKYELDVEEVASNDAVPKAGAAAPAPAPKVSPTVVSAGAKTIKAPMPGKILEIPVKPGDSVKRGDVVLILEAMKMKNEIVAPHDGGISEVRVSAGATVSTGDVLIVLS